MILGFYYHISIYKDSCGNLFMPAYLGLFVDELAKNVDRLLLFAHTTILQNENEQNYKLESENIQCIDLGIKKNHPNRLLFGPCLLKNFKEQIKQCDVLLVRAPSPLAPHFSRYRKYTSIAYLMVGDYLDLIKKNKAKDFRQWIANVFVRYNEVLQNRAIAKNTVLVNSHALWLKYKPINDNVSEVRTTTLKETDFYFCEDRCTKNPIRILVVGRIEKQKGVFVIFDAVRELISEGNDIELHFVGQEDGNKKYVVESLREKAEKENITSKIVFHGYIPFGNALFDIYRSSDIYVLASFSEGFPRAIWEAMASSVPVVATKVGSIPFYLKDKETALLVDPSNSIQLKDAILNVMKDGDLRHDLIRNAYKLVRDNTLDIQTKKIIDLLSYSHD